MAQWVGLVFVVVGWVLGLGSSFVLERFRSRVTLRGGARLLVSDLRDAQEQLAAAGGGTGEAAAIDRARELWHAYRGDLARSMGDDDWEIVSLLMRFVWRLTDARNVDTAQVLGLTLRLLEAVVQGGGDSLLPVSRLRTPAADGEPTTFSDLTWALGLADERQAAEERRRFAAQYGEIVYLDVEDGSGVALTARRRRASFGSSARFELRYHRESHWATRGRPRAAHILHRCDTIAIKAEVLLQGVMQAVTLLATAQLSTLVLRAPNDDEVSFYDRAADLLEDYLMRTAPRTALRAFLRGALIPAVAIGVGVAAAEIAGPSGELRAAAACCAAGGAGALVWVLARSRRIVRATDVEVGAEFIARIAAVWPLLGVAIGAAVWAIAGPLLNASTALSAAIAFILATAVAASVRVVAPVA